MFATSNVRSARWSTVQRRHRVIAVRDLSL